jgi:hypothetical protein
VLEALSEHAPRMCTYIMRPTTHDAHAHAHAHATFAYVKCSAIMIPAAPCSPQPLPPPLRVSSDCTEPDCFTFEQRSKRDRADSLDLSQCSQEVPYLSYMHSIVQGNHFRGGSEAGAGTGALTRTLSLEASWCSIVLFLARSCLRAAKLPATARLVSF